MLTGLRTYWVAGELLTDHADATAQTLLGQAWHAGERPVCGCRPGGVSMYVAAVGSSFRVKRMPGTGPAHHHGCPSYEPSGSSLPGVDDTDPSRTVLQLALPERPDRRSSRRSRGGARRLRLAELLGYLWREAGLNAWSPGMRGNRHWGVVSWHLREAAHGKWIHRRPLSEQLYVPEPFRSARKHEHAQRRRAAWNAALRGRGVLLILGEARAIRPATYGHQLLIKHLPDAPIYLDNQVHGQLLREQLAAVELIEGEGHVMVIAAVAVTPKGHAKAREVALMKATDEWLPYRAGIERRILTDAVDQQRRFTAISCHPAPGDGPSTTLVLTDTPRPVAVHLIPPTYPPPDGTHQWVWEPDTPFPAARPVQPRQPFPASSPTTEPKEQVTHRA